MKTNGKIARLQAAKAELSAALADLGYDDGNGKPKPELVKYPKVWSPVPDITCHRCKFWDLPVEDESLDAVITDVPYVKPWREEHLERFAQWCAQNSRKAHPWLPSTVKPDWMSAWQNSAGTYATSGR